MRYYLFWCLFAVPVFGVHENIIKYRTLQKEIDRLYVQLHDDVLLQERYQQYLDYRHEKIMSGVEHHSKTGIMMAQLWFSLKQGDYNQAMRDIKDVAVAVAFLCRYYVNKITEKNDVKHACLTMSKDDIFTCFAHIKLIFLQLEQYQLLLHMLQYASLPERIFATLYLITYQLNIPHCKSTKKIAPLLYKQCCNQQGVVTQLNYKQAKIDRYAASLFSLSAQQLACKYPVYNLQTKFVEHTQYARIFEHPDNQVLLHMIDAAINDDYQQLQNYYDQYFNHQLVKELYEFYFSSNNS